MGDFYETESVDIYDPGRNGDGHALIPLRLLSAKAGACKAGEHP
jgi:hypothetical protein